MDALRSLIVLDALAPIGTVIVVHHTGSWTLSCFLGNLTGWILRERGWFWLLHKLMMVYRLRIDTSERRRHSQGSVGKSAIQRGRNQRNGIRSDHKVRLLEQNFHFTAWLFYISMSKSGAAANTRMIQH